MSASNEAISPIGLHLTFAAGKGVATLRERQLGVVEVERLDLEIPKLVFPFDISGGTTRFQSRRCIVRAAAFSLREEVVEGWLKESIKESDLRVKIRDGYLSIAGRYSWQPEASIELTARVFADISNARSAFLLVDDLRLYGVSPVPAPLIAISLLRRLQPILPDTYRVIGSCAAEVEPLRLMVAHYLPALGWKIPDVREVRLEEVKVSDGKISFKYGPADAISQPASPSKATLRAKEALRLFSASEDLLTQGKLQEALHRLRRDAERVGEHPFIDLRIAEIVAVDPEQRALAQAHVEAALARHEGSPIEARLLALSAQLYLREQDPRSAKPYLEKLSALAEASEDPDEALFSGHWIARAIRETEPLPAISRLEKLSKQHAGHKPTILALADLYERAGHYEELALLWRELAATEEDATQAALLRARLGDLYLQKIQDPLRAKGQYERALSRDPHCIEAWCGLSDVLVSQNDTRAALLATEEALSAAKTNAQKAKIHVKAGIIWESALSDPESASLRYGEALLLVPQMPDALWRMAELHKARRRYARAASCYEELARHKELSAQERAKAFLALAELLEDFLGDPEEATACARKALALDPNNQRAQSRQERAPQPKKQSALPAASPVAPAEKKSSNFSAQRPTPTPRRSIENLETPTALPVQKMPVAENPTPPQRPVVKREITPVFLQEDKLTTPEGKGRAEEPRQITPKPPRAEEPRFVTPPEARAATPRAEEPRFITPPESRSSLRPEVSRPLAPLDPLDISSQEEDVALEALADLALFGDDFPESRPAKSEPVPAKLDSLVIDSRVYLNESKPAPAPLERAAAVPKISNSVQLLQSAIEVSSPRVAFCYQEIAAALQGTSISESSQLDKRDFTAPADAQLAPRGLFLGLASFVGALSANLSPEVDPGSVTLAEELFSIAAELDAPRFALRWVEGDDVKILLTDVATLEVGAQLSSRSREERFILLAHAICSLRVSLPIVQKLSANELEELIFLMAAAIDPVSVVADEGSLSEGLRAQAEALLARVPESKKEALVPAVSVLLDSYGAIDFRAFQRGLIEESWREVLCAGGSLSLVLQHTAKESRLSVEQALSDDTLTRRLALFACQTCNAPISH